MDSGSGGCAARLEEVPVLPPILVAPKPQEKLPLYIAATNQVVSAALVAEREADDEPATMASEPSDKQGAYPASSGPEAEAALQDLKRYLSSPQYLSHLSHKRSCRSI